MGDSIQISLSDDLSREVEELAREEGKSSDEIISRALREHLLLRKFHLLRDRLRSKAESQTGLTDQDVFDRVS